MNEKLNKGYRNPDYIKAHIERIKRLKEMRRRNPVLLQKAYSWKPGDHIS